MSKSFESIVVIVAAIALTACAEPATPPGASPAVPECLGAKCDSRAPSAKGDYDTVDDFRVTILETLVGDSLDDGTLGHEGWSSLVEVVKDGEVFRLLVDTGSNGAVGFENASRMPYTPLVEGGDLDETATFADALALTEELFLTHWHYDHIDGLLGRDATDTDAALFELVNQHRCEALSLCDDAALTRLHVGRGFFDKRMRAPRDLDDPFPSASEFAMAPNHSHAEYLASQLETLGIQVVAPCDDVTNCGYVVPTEIIPGVLTTGVTPRELRQAEDPSAPVEENYPGRPARRVYFMLDDAGNVIEDTVPDDQAVVIHTNQGSVIVTGCGHSGARNIVHHVSTHPDLKSNFDTQGIFGLIGGLHLVGQTWDFVEQTGVDLRNRYQVRWVYAGHCSLVNPVFTLRAGYARALYSHDHPHIPIDRIREVPDFVAGTFTYLQQLDGDVNVAASGTSFGPDGPMRGWAGRPVPSN